MKLSFEVAEFFYATAKVVNTMVFLKADGIRGFRCSRLYSCDAVVKQESLGVLVLLGLGYPEEMRRVPITNHAIGIPSRRPRQEVGSSSLRLGRNQKRIHFPENRAVEKFRKCFSFYLMKRVY